MQSMEKLVKMRNHDGYLDYVHVPFNDTNQACNDSYIAWKL